MDDIKFTKTIINQVNSGDLKSFFEGLKTCPELISDTEFCDQVIRISVLDTNYGYLFIDYILGIGSTDGFFGNRARYSYSHSQLINWSLMYDNHKLLLCLIEKYKCQFNKKTISERFNGSKPYSSREECILSIKSSMIDSV